MSEDEAMGVACFVVLAATLLAWKWLSASGVARRERALRRAETAAWCPLCPDAARLRLLSGRPERGEPTEWSCPSCTEVYCLQGDRLTLATSWIAQQIRRHGEPGPERLRLIHSA